MKSKSVLITILLLALHCIEARAQSVGDSLFATPQIHTINITFHQTAFWDSLLANYAVDREMPADVEINGRMLPNTAVQLKGNSSFNSYPGVKKSWNLDFNDYVSGQNYDGLKKLNLNNGFKDPTMLREKVFLEFCRMIGLPAPRCSFAKVFVNGTYWGFYTVVEQAGKPFCELNFGDNDGNLFKGDPHGDLKWKGPWDSVYYNSYELKTNETANDWSDLVKLIDKINNTPPAGYYDTLSKYMDMDSWLKYWAANIIFANLDSYTGSGHNYYLYHDLTLDKWRWIMWDANEAFGNFNMGMTLEKLYGLNMDFISLPPQNRPLMFKMLGDNTCKTHYINTVCYLTENFFRSDVLYPLIDSLADAIRTDYYADPNKMFNNQQFEDNLIFDINVPGLPGGTAIAGLKSFITQRRDSLGAELALYGCYLGMRENVPGAEPGIYPNPATDILYVKWSGNDDPLSLEIFDLAGRRVYFSQLAGMTKGSEICADVSSLHQGVYLIKFMCRDACFARKFVVTEN